MVDRKRKDPSVGGATFFAFPVSVCIGSGANFASSCAFLRLFLLVFYFYLYYSYYCFLFLCFHLFRSESIHRGFWVPPIPAERMSPPAESLTGGRLIPPGGRQVPQGWPLMTNVPIRHVAVPSTARYPVAAHCCLGFGIFYRGCHLRGPANEDRALGPLRHFQTEQGTAVWDCHCSVSHWQASVYQALPTWRRSHLVPVGVKSAMPQ